MGAPRDFMQDSVEVDAVDVGPADGNWVFIPNSQVRAYVQYGEQGMRKMDQTLRDQMRYSGEGVAVISVPLMQWVKANGWPGAGFVVAVMQEGGGLYVLPHDTVPDPSTRIAEA